MEIIREVIEDELHLEIPIAGLVKNDRHRTSELLFGFPPKVIGIKVQSQLFRLLEQITFHNDKRSKRQIASAFDNIKGIGDKTKTALLKEFKSMKRVKEASFEEIASIIGKAKAKIIIQNLNSQH